LRYDMNMSPYSYKSRMLALGLLLWVLGTLAIRLVGHRVLHAHQAVQTLILYALSFVVMGLLVRRIVQPLQRDLRPAAATLLMLPTLILDPFSCAFFPAIFPNIEPAAAGVFGGWMLIFCAGAVAGVWIWR